MLVTGEIWAQSKENFFFLNFERQIEHQCCCWISSGYLQPAPVEPAWIPSLQESHSISPPWETSSMSWQGYSPACFSVLMREMKTGLYFRAEDLNLINSMRRSAGPAQRRWELHQGLRQQTVSGTSSPAAYRGPALQLGWEMSSVHQPSFVYPWLV